MCSYCALEWAGLTSRSFLDGQFDDAGFIDVLSRLLRISKIKCKNARIAGVKGERRRVTRVNIDYSTVKYYEVRHVGDSHRIGGRN